MASSSKIKVEKYRKGRSRGGIYTVPSGGRCYLAHTSLTYIFRAGEPSISDAVRKGTACWSIDEETLLNMRTTGVRFVGVLCKETSDIWLTHTAAFFDREQTVMPPTGKSGRRYLPLNRFRKRAGKVSL